MYSGGDGLDVLGGDGLVPTHLPKLLCHAPPQRGKGLDPIPNIAKEMNVG